MLNEFDPKDKTTYPKTDKAPGNMQWLLVVEWDTGLSFIHPDSWHSGRNDWETWVKDPDDEYDVLGYVDPDELIEFLKREIS